MVRPCPCCCLLLRRLCGLCVRCCFTMFSMLYFIMHALCAQPARASCARFATHAMHAPHAMHAGHASLAMHAMRAIHAVQALWGVETCRSVHQFIDKRSREHIWHVVPRICAARAPWALCCVRSLGRLYAVWHIRPCVRAGPCAVGASCVTISSCLSFVFTMGVALERHRCLMPHVLAH